MKYVATVGSRTAIVEVTRDERGYRVTLDGQVWEVDARLTAHGAVSLIIDGVSHVAEVDADGGSCLVGLSGESYAIQVEDQSRYIIRTRGGAGGAGSGQTLKAPLPGKVTHVAVRAGDTVAAGQALVVIEAMKMENELKASAAGTVQEIRVAAGQAVNAGDVLLVIA